MKTALVYDRVNKWGGAERVLLALHEIFPDAPLYTSVYYPQNAAWANVFPEVKHSYLQRFPFARSRHELFAPLMPSIFESHDFSKFDLVISVTSEAAKGIITPIGTYHLCYCLTPTRYLWSGYDDYFSNQALKVFSKPVLSYLRKWDIAAAGKPDHIIGISTEVQERIRKYYKRESSLVFPPVDLSKFKVSNKKRENFYLLVSRLVPYKKVDLAIKAFNKLGLPLTIVGSGSQKNKLKKIALENITFLQDLSDEELSDLYSSCKALIFPQIEDFGLVAVEAQATGAPVIAFKKAGALDIIIDGKTGVFFEKLEEKSLINAIKSFSHLKFDSNIISNNAKRFSKERFQKEFLKTVYEKRVI